MYYGSLLVFGPRKMNYHLWILYFIIKWYNNSSLVELRSGLETMSHMSGVVLGRVQVFNQRSFILHILVPFSESTPFPQRPQAPLEHSLAFFPFIIYSLGA